MYKRALEMNGFCRLTNEPEIKSVNNGSVTNVKVAFNIGTSEKPETIYGTLSFWGNDANTIMNYHKGHLFYVEGPFKMGTWIDNQNNPKAEIKIDVTKWRSLEKSQNTGNQVNNNTQQNNYNNGTNQYNQNSQQMQQPQAQQNWQNNRQVPQNNNGGTQQQPTSYVQSAPNNQYQGNGSLPLRNANEQQSYNNTFNGMPYSEEFSDEDLPF